MVIKDTEVSLDTNKYLMDELKKIMSLIEVRPTVGCFIRYMSDCSTSDQDRIKNDMSLTYDEAMEKITATLERNGYVDEYLFVCSEVSSDFSYVVCRGSKRFRYKVVDMCGKDIVPDLKEAKVEFAKLKEFCTINSIDYFNEYFEELEAIFEKA